MRRSIVALITGLLVMPAAMASAHSGGLNAQGCHAGSQPYHCHRSPSSPSPALGTIRARGGQATATVQISPHGKRRSASTVKLAQAIPTV
jgi:hypothetical protein